MDKLVKITSALATRQSFLAEYSVPSCVQNFNKIRLVEDAYKDESPPLSRIAKQFSKDYMYAYLEMWIVSLNSFSNVKSKMNPSQMREVASYIFQDYYYLKISDIYLVFTNAKKGRYGEFYGRLDGTMILSWFDKYAEERFKVAESLIGVTYEKTKNSKTADKENKRVFKAIERVAESKKYKIKGSGMD